MRYVIIGAGWYGCHLACELAKEGHQVVLLEKNTDILSETSGNFGVRLHRGPHYPRSRQTRDGCRRGFDEFRSAYPELLVEHEASIYAHGLTDAKGFASQVTRKHFEKVCQENLCVPIDLKAAGYQEIDAAFNLDESSIVVGEALRAYFRTKLKNYNVELHLAFKVDSVLRTALQTQVKQGEVEIQCDAVINTTGFQFYSPTRYPFKMDVVYQPCIALKVRDKQPRAKATSFIVMDGWFPCLMPYVEQRTALIHDYILTHGCWTILDSCATPKEANQRLTALYENDEVISNEIMPRVYAEMERFWPGFSERFEYTGWKGGVIAKIRNEHEFRGAVTFRDPLGMIHVIPGKIQNIFDVKREVSALLNNQATPLTPNSNFLPRALIDIPSKQIEYNGGFSYVLGGVLFQAWSEISTPPRNPERNTCNLKTIVDIERMQKVNSSPNLLELQNEAADYPHRPRSAPDRSHCAYKSQGFFFIVIPNALLKEMKRIDPNWLDKLPAPGIQGRL